MATNKLLQYQGRHCQIHSQQPTGAYFPDKGFGEQVWERAGQRAPVPPAAGPGGQEGKRSKVAFRDYSSGSSSRLSPERPSPRLGHRTLQRCARQTNRGPSARSWAGSPPTPPQLKPSPVTTQGLLGGREGAAAPDTLGSLRVCNFARRTAARRRTPRRAARTLPRATHPPPGAQRRGASSLPPHLLRPADRRGTCCALLPSLSPVSSLPPSENYTLPVPLEASPSGGRAEAGAQGDRKGVET
ncbi:uncharacterized protein [Kogia breviceps]|uniref:uncharacterized protein n=1 Tax=Kogia breviceps TaxID=27615 RepID=UPI0034D2866C